MLRTLGLSIVFFFLFTCALWSQNIDLPSTSDSIDLRMESGASLWETPTPAGQESYSEVAPPFFTLDTPYSRAMLDFQNRQTDKELLILENNASTPFVPTLILSGQARLSLLAASTNTEDKFSYMGRFPTDFSGNSATDARIVQANSALTAHLSPWINLYGELLFSDVFSFPDHKQGSLQMRQAFAVFGDLTQSPWYGLIGKKNAPFGDMSTLSPFSQSLVWHYFGTLHEGIGGGYAGSNFRATVMALNGGRGIRVADSSTKGQLNNLAANLTFQGGDSSLGYRLGAGFLLGTIYDGNVAEHLDPLISGPLNSAWDINGQLLLGKWTFEGEFVSTANDWPVTQNRVLAYRTEMAYDSFLFACPTRYSVSWSEGIQGPIDSEFQFNQQLVLGMAFDLGPNAMASLEYVRSLGFAPLMNITTVSDRDVVQDSFVGGLTIVF